MSEDATEKALAALKAAGASFLRHQVTNDALLFGETPERGNDARASLRYHVARDNGLGDLLQGSKISNVITKDDVENILTDIATRYKDLTQAQLQHVRSKLEGSIGASRENLGELHQQAESVATEYAADNAQQNLTPQQKMEKLLLDIDHDSKDIDDDFEKMGKAGVVFDKQDWEQRKQLRLYVAAHPEDMEAKEKLNAKEQKMIKDAEPQVSHCPGAQESFDDAKQKNQDQEAKIKKAVALHEALVAKDSTGYNWNSTQGENVSMNDVRLQNIGQSPSTKGKTLA